ncbi:4-hydroxy-tetrahydrodipicolinate reductase [Anaerocellum diazotrophicum]|uniref:4-hydroxy-tetrahydrodipicolinate reductase n=1 Tax=Caldicellulosiruptor diazotrophicus TaxID=2806205 RepID=A0ABN6E7K4_9FIRM|nr:4-hydroxy-tetrahydrodipicolinate reductase [Caldicellulosiruptor diazotrophicus]BCS81413.1 4-hydroxy-tetrahydrodipicolinate reductase [Caldicellulosiruptor diazotrophicus]
MISILLNGCNGKMGQVVSKVAKNYDNIKIVAGVDLNTDKNFDYPVYQSPEEVVENFDVIIDFSLPEATMKILEFAKQKNKPVVIATTGFTSDQKTKILKYSKQIPIFWSANMSLGVNLVAELIQKAFKALGPSFDIEIIEKHHNQKIDSPSGTALMLADAINEVANNSYEYIYDRHTRRKKRQQNEIGISSVRGGTIVGEHSVIFAGPDEIIEIKHTALSKEIFANGAIKAAMFIQGKGAGIYNMKDLINSM